VPCKTAGHSRSAITAETHLETMKNLENRKARVARPQEGVA
jgi:hypothetical protein